VTAGFWAETPSRPESYFALQAGKRVLVTETRTRLYPLAPGIAHVGPASADVVLAEGGGGGLPSWLSGVRARRLTLRSRPFDVRVKALPPGPPAGFDGAVGTFGVRWSADRTRTSQDVPAVVQLDVRGVGNLPLLRTPALAPAGAEALAGTTQDSLAPPGTLSPGRRRFQWNVLPRQPGRLSIPCPVFAWYDPAAGSYRSAALSPLGVDVGPTLFSSGVGRDAFPPVFLRDAPDPFVRGVAPWVWALAGMCTGAAVALWRTRRRADPFAEERARVAAWRNALRSPAGPAFWRTAEETAAWLQARGVVLEDVRPMIESTRYGGGEADADAVRLRLTKGLAGVLPRPPARRPTRAAAIVLIAAGATLVALKGVTLGDSAGALQLRAADRLARGGEVARARAAWVGMWNEGARAPALAARLAWAELTRGALGPAAVWVLRGDQAGARDPALDWVADLVREGGGLTGEPPVRLPVRRMEWALLGLVLGVGAGALWPRRFGAVALAVLALVCAAVEPAQDGWAARSRLAVVGRSVTLQGTGLELEPGQVVRLVGGDGGLTRVRAGRDLDGHLPSGALLPVGSPR
jgi:hypothetical protein